MGLPEDIDPLAPGEDAVKGLKRLGTFHEVLTPAKTWCVVLIQPSGLGMSTRVFGPYTLDEAIELTRMHGGHACEMRTF